MCLVAPGRITAIHGSSASVTLDGRLRAVSIALEPDVVVGDWVVVAGGVVVRRIAPTTAQDMQAAVEAAREPAAIVRHSSGRSPS
jgi:hydrogenase assembly chaperone HypC/HupF